MTFRFALAVLAACSATAHAASNVTLERLLSAPFPSDLIASASGGRIAWVSNERGARNIWTAAPPSYTGARLTSYKDDDGQEIAEMAFTPGGESIVYVRGGDFEFPGKSNPNPASLTQGVEQEIWIVPFSGGAPRKLAEGNSPTVSPSGDAIVFLKKGDLFTMKLAPDSKPEQLLHANGRASSVRWSPDGRLLAFVSGRGDHAFVAVYDFQSKAIHYLDPSVDRDLEPVWSPDSRRIAFVRIPATRRDFTFGPVREGEPWSILVADASTGATKRIWRANEGPGSVFHAVVADNQLFWAEGDAIVFPWESTGWLHLYAVSAESGPARPLNSPGEYEVEFASLTPDRSAVLYASNENDIDRRHLWRVPVAGGAPTELTPGSGIEWSPIQSGDAIAFLASSATVPAHAEILTAHSTAPQNLAPGALPAGFPSSDLVTPQQVIFSSADGLSIHGQLFLPPNQAPGKHAAMIFFHGGSRRQMLLGWHSMDYYHNSYAMNQYLASLGYVVLSVNYRSGIGYGLNFREAIHYGATGASEFNDVQGAGVYLRGRADVDPARIGLWGGSYGGYLTALGLARASNLFAVGVDFHGVHDWNTEIPNFVPAYDPSKNQDVARIAFESSPLASISTWRSPVLLIHGDDDRNVPFAETVHLVEALRKQHVEFQQLIIPDEIHGFLRTSSWLRAYTASAEFLNRHLHSETVKP